MTVLMAKVICQLVMDDGPDGKVVGRFDPGHIWGAVGHTEASFGHTGQRSGHTKRHLVIRNCRISHLGKSAQNIDRETLTTGLKSA